MAEMIGEGVMDGLAEGEVADPGRRKLLLGATAAVGAVGVAFTAVPFVESWLPSARAIALGAPTEVDLSKIEPGQMIVTSWRRNPIFIVHRTPEMMALLGNHNNMLKDAGSSVSAQPDYCKNAMRSRTAEWFACIGTCTHLGCLPKPVFDAHDPVIGAYWPGGWLCPCHGSRYDISGRVFDGSPAPLNLNIMPYAFSGPAKVIIGVDSADEAKKSA
ncbi:MAG: ubiquinol-cytochrome c reductase iron-sulfur subunit [Steroidobacteraceae bacterium]